MTARPDQQKPLLIVESPTKARTLKKLLGRRYGVVSSRGHIRDLPEKELGVDVENDYAPSFRTIPGKQKVVKELRAAAAHASEVLLATDPDREGEAIAWHIANVLKQPVERVEFHEITRSAVALALKQPHAINRQRVDSQIARRVLDRLVGYGLSPVLWRKVKRGLSAGRVQSVAVRLLCEREEAIRAFAPKEYWTVEGTFASDARTFAASLTEFDGVRIVHPDKLIEGKNRIIPSEAAAREIESALKSLTYSVESVEEKEVVRAPAPPFTTATLQQDAFSKLGFRGQRTMRLAQQLYEGVDVGRGPEGLITYMRTDSVRVAHEFVTETRDFIGKEFGAPYVPASPRQYRARKRAQEAHEAIRPTNIAYAPELLKDKLSPELHKLYALVYNRYLASQMSSARFAQKQIAVLGDGREHTARFQRTGSTLVFDGFLRVYRDSAGRRDESADGTPDTVALEAVASGMALTLSELASAQHFTKPPARYTEGSLIRALEHNGIGRPSTYVPIIETIIKRGYVTREKKALVPTEWAFVTNRLLADYFPEIVDVAFTARMEEKLDEVEQGRQEWPKLVDELYQPLSAEIESALADKKRYRAEPKLLDEKCPLCGEPLVERHGRFGKFIACSNYPKCTYVKKNHEVRQLGETCPKCGAALVVRRNRWGVQFIACSAYPKCDYAREPQEKCPKCGGNLIRKQAKNRAIFYVCEHYRPDGGGTCDFRVFGRPVVDLCPLCGWFLVERKRKGKTQVFCSNPECANHAGLQE